MLIRRVGYTGKHGSAELLVTYVKSCLTKLVLTLQAFSALQFHIITETRLALNTHENFLHVRQNLEILISKTGVHGGL